MSSENKSAPYCSQDYREVQAYDDMTAETYTALLYIKSLTSIMETIIFTTATEVGAVVLLDYRRNKLRRDKHFSHCYVGQTWIQTRQSRYTVCMDITMTSCASVLNV